MQATGSSLMRRLSSAIHPPLPLDARQTKQLLAALTSSFQRHLDARYPTTSSVRTNQAIATGLQQQKPSHQPVSSFVEAEKHFDSIITHPIFAGAPAQISPSSGSQERVVLSSFNLFQNHLKHGSLTPAIVSSCIKTISITSLPPQKIMELSLGLQITNLLRTTNQVSLEEVLSVKNTSVAWCSLMFMEGHKEHVWNFIKDGFSSRAKQLPIPLLHVYMRTCNSNRDFESSFNTFLTALNDPQVPNTLRDKLLPYFTYYAYALLWNEEGIKAITPEKYNRLATRLSALRLNSQYSIGQQFLSAVMQLVHPQNPNPTLMMQYVEQLSNHPGDFANATSTARQRDNILRATFQAASLYFSTGSYRDAQTMLRFAQVNFPKELHNPKAEEAHVSIPKSKTMEVNDSAILSKLDGLLAT